MEFYNSTKIKYDSLELKNTNVEFLETKQKDFNETFSKFLEINDYTKHYIQDAIQKDYNTKYKNSKYIRFNNEKEVINFINEINRAYYSRINYLMLISVKNFYAKKVSKLEQYKIRNLKRLNITEKQYNSLSEKDKDLLWKEFK